MSRPPKPLRLRYRKDTQKYEMVGPHPISGEDLREQTGTGDLEKAQDYLAQYLAGVDASNGIPKRHDPTLRDLLDAYQRTKEEKVSSKGTLVQNLNHLRRHLGGVKPWQVSDQTLERYLKLRQEDTYTIPNTKITKTGAADSTVRRELSTLSQALKWAKREREKDWFMGRGYHDDFRYPVKSKTTRRHKWLKKKKMRTIAKAAEPHCLLFIKLAIASAARHTAILELTWDMVDLETGEIDFGEAIGNKDRPATKVSKKVLKLLREAYEIRCTDHVIEYGGKPLKSIDTAFNKAVIRAGFVSGTYSNGQKKAKYTVHVLKHTSITWMVHKGMSYERIAQLTCTSPQVIQKHYGHHDPSLTKDAQKATDF
ncbi:tyrosine-type recombinase/integrase [Magnetovibrio sp. PR-2]|uniref:tyrosine-type recombinase/integrase n=1 Tax=Magnetovibrio sp. PR-2 TaxID=3120356 RepID=UPI002FCE26F4